MFSWVRYKSEIYYINMTYTTEPELLVWVRCVCQIYYINMTYTTDPDFFFFFPPFFSSSFFLFFFFFFFVTKNNTPKNKRGSEWVRCAVLIPRACYTLISLGRGLGDFDVAHSFHPWTYVSNQITHMFF